MWLEDFGVGFALSQGPKAKGQGLVLVNIYAGGINVSTAGEVSGLPFLSDRKSAPSAQISGEVLGLQLGLLEARS